MAIHTSSDIIAQRYVVSSSVSHYTSSAASGSHIFGDSPDDTHQFTGSLLISGSRISLTDGKNNTIFGSLAGLNITTGVKNIIIGDEAGDAGNFSNTVLLGFQAGSAINSTDANGTVAIGYQAGIALTSGLNNMAIGYQALKTATANDYNTAIGYTALYSISGSDGTEGEGNTAVGYRAGYSTTTGNENTFLGKLAGYSNTTGINNNFIGVGAGQNSTTANQSTYIGWYAAYYQQVGGNNVAIGHQTLYGSSGKANSATQNVAIGYQAAMGSDAGYGITAVGDRAFRNISDSGSLSTAIGYAAGFYASGSNNTFVGAQAGYGGTTSAPYSSGQYNVAMGGQALEGFTTANYNTAIGHQAGEAITSGIGNAFLGFRAGLTATTADYSVGIGYGALGDATLTGNYNIGIGLNAGMDLTSGAGNIILGYNAGDAMTGTSYTVLIGQLAGSAINSTDANGTVAVGYGALTALTDGQRNVAMGYNAGNEITTGDKNTVIGYEAGSELKDDLNNTLLGSHAGSNVESDENTFIGVEAGEGSSGNTTGGQNTAVGYRSMESYTTANKNVAVGDAALQLNTTGNQNVSIGMRASQYNTVGANTVVIGNEAGRYATGSHNIFVGSQAGQGGTTSAPYSSGTKNTAVGHQALTSFTTAVNNVAIGYESGYNVTTGYQLTTIGYRAGRALTTQTNNTFIGFDAGIGNTGSSNVAIGNQSLNASAGGSNNIAIGGASLFKITGDYNTAIGVLAMETHTTGTRNIAIGYAAMDDTDAGSNSLGSSDNIFIGYNAGGGTWADVASIQNVVIGNNSADASFSGANYNVGMGTNVYGALTQGDANSAFGHGSLTALTTGGSNVAVGNAAGGTMTGTSNTVLIGSGAGNAINSTDANGTVAIGYEALILATSGAGNTAIGYQAGHELTTGHSNTFVGYEAGGDFDSGESNMTAIGRNAMGSADNDSSSNSVAIGVGALEGGTGVIISNVAIGNDAMSSTGVRQATGNIAVGQGAMDSTFGGTLTDVIAIGRDSMHHASNQLNGVTGAIGIGFEALNALTTGDYNIAIGYQAGDAITTGANNIVIGYGADVSAADASNETVIGNSSQTSVVFGGSNTKISGSATSTGSFGMVGVGVASPSEELEVAGTIKASQHIVLGQGFGLYLDGGGDTNIRSDTANEIEFNTGGSERMRLNNSGNLTVTGNITGNDVFVATNRFFRITADSSNSSGGFLFGDSSGTGGDIKFLRNADSKEILKITATGKISGSSTSTGSFGSLSLGESSHIHTLSIKGHSEGSTGIRVRHPSDDTLFEVKASEDDGRLRLFANNSRKIQLHANDVSYLNGGNVGIGLESPDGTLHVHTATAGSVTANANADDLVVENSDHGGISILTPDDKIGYLVFGDVSDSARAGFQYYHAGVDSNERLLFNVSGGEKARLTDAGDFVLSSGDVSGSSTSTGSFGSLVVDNAVQGDLQINGNAYIKGGGLDLDSNQLITGQKTVNGGTAFTFLKMYDGGDASIQLGSKHSLGYISFQAGNGSFTERMRIKNNGDIAIFNSHLSGSASSTGSFGSVHAEKLHINKTGLTVDTVNEIARIQGSAATTNTHLIISSGVSASTVANRFIDLSSFDHNPTARALCLQKAGGNVGIGETSPDGLLHIKGSTPDIIFEDTSGGSNSAILKFKKTSASEADDDAIGEIDFRGLNDADEEILYSYIVANSTDVSDGTEDGRLGFYVMNNGARPKLLELEGTKISGSSTSTGSFGAGRFSEKVGIGTTSPFGHLEIIGEDGTVSGTPDGDARELVIRNDHRAGISIIAGEGTGDTSNVIFGSTSDMNGGSVNYDFNLKQLRMQSQHPSAELSLASANNVEAVRIDTSQRVGIGTDSPTEALTVVGDISASLDIHLDGSIRHSGELYIRPTSNLRLLGTVMTFGSAAGSEYGRFDSSGRLGIGVSPSQKLHVSSSGTSALIEGRGNGNVPILHVKDTADTMVALFEGNRAGDTGAAIHIYHNPTTSQETNRTRLNFEMNDSGGTKTVYAQLASFIDDHTNGTEDGHLKINTMTGGSVTEHLHIGNNKISGSSTSTGSFGLLQTTDRIQTPSDSLKLKGNLTLDGTNIPTLHLDGLVDAIIRIDKAASYRAAHLRFDTAGSADWFIGTPDSDNYGDGDELYFGTSADTPIVAIDPNASTGLLNLTSNKISGSATTTGSFGHMILNCGSPKKVLQIGRAGYKYIYANNANDDDIPTFQTYNDGTNYYGLGQEVFGTYLVSDDNSNDERAHIAFYVNSRPNDNGTAGSPKMIISGSSGKVGIGTTSPDSKLSISATSNTTFEALQLENLHGEGTSQGTVDIVGDVVASNGLTARGRIQFREATNDANVSVIAFFTSNNTSLEPTERMTIAQDGVISGDFNDTSDIALKENISEISSSYERVKQLNPVKFNWKEEEEKGTDEQIGFIAQEVEKVYPELVRGEEGSRSVNVVGLVSVLTKTVQELTQKVEELEDKLK